MRYAAVGITVVLPLLLAGHRAAPQDDGLKNLPVHRYIPAGPPVGGIVFFSGDGGWRSFDQNNGDSLQARGYWVLGVDDFRLFETEMSGDSLAAVGRRLVTAVRARLPTGAPVYLAGYSFGASIVADMAARGVPSDGLYLLGPGRRGIRKITVGGFLDHDPTGPTSFDVAERLNARGCIPVVFVTGEDDTAGKGALVFLSTHGSVQQFMVAGASHHYHGGDSRYMRVAQAALDWLNLHRAQCTP